MRTFFLYEKKNDKKKNIPLMSVLLCRRYVVVWHVFSVFSFCFYILLFVFFSLSFFHFFFLFFLPARSIRPINSFLPILSKSITIISKEHSLIFSQGTLKLKDSLNLGLSVHLKIGVLRFSILLSPNCSQTFTYGSRKRI